MLRNAFKFPVNKQVRAPTNLKLIRIFYEEWKGIEAHSSVPTDELYGLPNSGLYVAMARIMTRRISSYITPSAVEITVSLLLTPRRSSVAFFTLTNPPALYPAGISLLPL